MTDSLGIKRQLWDAYPQTMRAIFVAITKHEASQGRAAEMTMDKLYVIIAEYRTEQWRKALLAAATVITGEMVSEEQWTKPHSVQGDHDAILFKIANDPERLRALMMSGEHE